MNQKYSSVLALELAIYQVHEDGYEPTEKIVEFWKKYDINTIQNTINTVLKHAPAYRKSGNIVQLCHKQIFAVDLMRLLIAYFHIHTDRIDISQLDISDAATTQSSLDQLEITKRIHEFFGGIID
ncbi:hypothetical protein [Sphingobacterium siyangense]|uniref:hypothetical protein n=1 Tax=Sphingobacterium siyangense TaxID=459529 RepID=UPI003DA48D90